MTSCLRGDLARPLMAHDERKRSACAMTARSVRLCAAGMHTWADITHESGRWLRWAEAMARFETLREGDREGYEALMRELQLVRGSTTSPPISVLVRARKLGARPDLRETT